MVRIRFPPAGSQRRTWTFASRAAAEARRLASEKLPLRAARTNSFRAVRFSLAFDGVVLPWW